MKTLRIASLALLTMLLTAGSVLAHHGWSSYDASKEMTLDGVIKESGYEHPHGHVRLEVPGKTWMLTLAPPSRMENSGPPAAMLAPGNNATVVGYPNRNDPN